MRKTRQNVGNWYWNLFVKACGSRCCVCLKADVPLHRGHIQRHVDGGDMSPKNLIPLCKSCNGKSQNGFTDDHRPVEWLDKFLKLILAEMGAGITCVHPQEGAYTLKNCKPTDNKDFLDLKNVQFALQTGYSTPSSTHTRPTLTTAHATRLMWELVDASKLRPIRPKPPLKKRQNEMKLAAMRVGAERFRVAGDAYLRADPWVVGDDRHAYAQADSWQHFCDCFEMYLEDGRKKAARVAAQAEVDRKRIKDDAENLKVYTRDRRWHEYLNTAKIPLWPGIPDDDAAFVAQAAAENDEVREITDEYHDRAIAVLRRYKHHKTDELVTEKQKLYDVLARCTEWAKAYDAESQLEYMNTIKQLRNWVDAMKDVEGLRKHSYSITDMENDLKPENAQVKFDESEC